MNNKKNNKVFQAKVLEALEKSELIAQEIVSSDCRVCLMVKIYGDFVYDKLKLFIGILDKSTIKYNSSFAPKGGVMNISIFKS